jgi:hypothetical protein
MPSRVRLDASELEGGRAARDSSTAIPPVPSLPSGAPAIPPRHSPVVPHNSSGLRRRSAPLKSRKSPRVGSEKPTASKNPSSPEVISNLIDSLSNISFPDPTEAEKLPPPPRIHRSNPRQGASFDGSVPGSPQSEYGAYRDTISNTLDNIDDAAEPPVVRTAKLPSTYYQLGRKGNKWENALGISAIGQNFYASQSNPSLVTMGSQEDIRNITVRKRENSALSESRESLKHDIIVKNSHKSPPVGSRSPGKTSRRDGSGGSRSEHSGHTKSTKTPPAPAFHEPILEDFYIPPQNRASAGSSKREGKRPAKSSPHVLSQSPIISAPSVPDRRSSLQIQDALPSEKQRPSAGSAAPAATNSSGTTRRKELEEPKTLTTFDLLSGEDTEVTKRIKELKAKKEQRDREARASLGPEVDSNGVPIIKRYAKDGTSTPRRAKRAPENLNLAPSTTPSANGHLGELAAYSRPTTPLTPTSLPINYSFVVKSLDEDRPISQSGSTKTTETPATQPPPNSNSVGGRSALSRAVVTKGLFASRRDSDSGTSPNRMRKQRQSLDTHTSKEPSQSRNQRSGSLSGKKRWSISDVPNGNLERHSSLRGVDGAQARMSLFQDAVPEERASMNDEINRAVEGFIHAQRLSQKIRHPQTGRVISFSEVGNPKGNVVFCCVGMGLTRYITAFYDELASTLNLRIITPDRPGVGESDTDPNGTPLSWAGTY